MAYQGNPVYINGVDASAGVATSALQGALTETAPATDTASSGQNGRLQRIAQRLTSLIALLPASLGQKAMAASLAVVVASDQSAVPVKPDQATSANTPAIVTSGGDSIASNASRKLWAVQNCGTNPLFVRMGTGASSSVFHVVLKGCSVADDGTGGYISDTVYTGVVSATGTSPRFVVTEL